MNNLFEKQTATAVSRPPFNLPKLADLRKPIFEIPNFTPTPKKVCRRCGKGLPKNADRPFADLICADCLKIWTEVETVLDKFARHRFAEKQAEMLKKWGGLFDGK